MRIVHTCLRYPPATGGTERYVHELVERTKDVNAGRDVRVLTSKLRTHGPLQELDPELLVSDPMYVQRLHHVATPVVSYPRLQALSYYIGHHQPDILHSYSFWYQPADVTARYAKKNKIPFIFHPIYYENKVRRKLSWRLYKAFWGQHTFAAADIVAVISPYEQSLIEQAGFPVKRFELLPPGIDAQQFERSRLNPYLKRKINGKILLSVGRIAKSKGLSDIIDVLPKVIKKYPDVHWAIAGEDFGAQHKLQQTAAKKGLENHIHWLGKLTDEELRSAYQHAYALLHPSRYEAFGIVLAESLAAGTPVIARNTAAIPYVVPHEQAGLLFNNEDELASHILTLLSEQSLRDKLGHLGRKYVTETFAWDKVRSKLLGLYDELKRT